MRRNAFTLIELLVVIAIIAILAAILFPLFARAQERAHFTACLSNEHQIMAALHQYATDNNNRLPYNPTYVVGPVQFIPRFWVYAVQPYVRNVQIFRCPTRAGQLTNASSSLTRDRYLISPYAVTDDPVPASPDPRKVYRKEIPAVGYGFNQLLLQGGYGSGNQCCAPPTPSSLDAIKVPTMIAVLGDGNTLYSPVYDHYTPTGMIHDYFWGWTRQGTMEMGQPMHNSGCNFAYADGHVRFQTPVRLSATAVVRGYYPDARL